MDLHFHKRTKNAYITRVFRDDSVVLEVPGFDRKYQVPHDAAHYLIETRLELRQGFWGCVAAGAIFPGMHVISGRQPPHAAEKSKAVIKTAGQRLIEAETLVAGILEIAMNNIDARPQFAIEQMKRLWTLRSPSQPTIKPALVTEVCTSLREFQKRWQALPVEGTIQVSWPSHGRRLS